MKRSTLLMSIAAVLILLCSISPVLAAPCSFCEFINISKGDQGDPGAPGAPGVNGTSPTITVNGTFTGLPGTSASVINIGDAVNAVFDFTIPAGEKGDPGAAGYSPIFGVDYFNGTDGAPGAPGTPGINGTDGSAATITINNTITGSPASVTNIGTPNAAIFDFTIPAGEKGDKGDQGDPGTPGVNGTTPVFGVDYFNGTDGAPGTPGVNGTAATININSTITGSPASVTNIGTATAAIFDFVIPAGEAGTPGINGTNGINGTTPVFGVDYFNGTDGAPGTPGVNGTAATIAVNYTGTLVWDEPATVVNVGTANAVLLDFGIPMGAKGEPGDNGIQGIPGVNGTTPVFGVDYFNGTDGAPGTPGVNGTAATININNTITGSPAGVTNIGTTTAAIFDFVIPAGEAGTPGINGTNGINGTSATVAVNYTFTGLPGTEANVTNVGNETVALFDITIPQGETGETGAAGATGGTGGQILYFRHAASTDPITYETLYPVPAGSAEDDESASVSSGTGQVLIDSYVTEVGYPALTQLPAGLWRFRTYHYVNNANGNTNAVFKVYNRTAGGTETLLFTATSDDINALAVDEYLTSYVQTAAYTVSLTDRIVVKVYGQSDSGSARTFHFVYEGSTHTSHIQTTLESAPATSLSFSVIAGETLYKGEAVYISGASGGNPVVSGADNTNTAKSRVVGLMVADTASGAQGQVRRAGALTSVDTRVTNVNINPLGQTWAAGDLLFATTGGGLTNVRPTSGRSVKAGYSLAGSSATDVLMAYPMENPVWSTAASSENIVDRLGDAAGATKLSIRDYTNAEVAYIDSDGNARINGTLVMDDGLIQNVTDPVDPQDAATKAYVDANSGGNTSEFLLLNGSRAMTGSLNAGTFNISQVGEPVAAQDAATKNYVDSLPAGTNLSAVYPIGTVYISTLGTNPNITLGFGNWSSIGTGYVLVGV